MSRRRVILVTGSTSGIGRAIAEARLSHGDEVLGLGRDHSKFEPQSSHYHPYSVDVEDGPALMAQLKTILAAHPNLDAVVSNAGYGAFGALENFSYAQIKAFMDVNLMSHILVSRACMPFFKARGGGQLILMGSESALKGAQKGSLYCTAKFGLRGLAQSLRWEGASKNVRTTIIHPGMVDTPFFNDLNFRPGPDVSHRLDPKFVARTVDSVLDADPMAVLDEITLSPLKHVIRFD